MELNEFVNSTITQIVEGIVSASKAIESTGAKINPSPNRSIAPRDIAFDIAVTQSQGGEVGGKAGVSGVLSVFLGFTAEAGGNYTKGSENLSRVKFSIPLMYPITPSKSNEVSMK